MTALPTTKSQTKPTSTKGTRTSLRDTIVPHAIFLTAAALLSLQGCSGASSAEPNPAAAKPVVAEATAPLKPHVDASQVEAGRYLVRIGGCNDCHTEGYMESNGAKPAESEWLQGSSVGFSGPWGVSYPANLRLRFQAMSEEEFLTLAHEGKGRPPMPWPSLMAMSDQDLKAIYAYVRSLGPKGKMVPAALSPGQKPDTPYVVFAPVMP